MKRFVLRFFLAVSVLCLVVAPVLVGLLASPGCTASQNRVAASITIVTAGAAVADLQRQNLHAYTVATDALGAQGLRGVAYLDAARDINTEAEANGEAIQTLAAVLYSAAQDVDSTRNGADFSAFQRAAAASLEGVDRALTTLSHGTLLPAFVIPPAVTAAIAALRAVAGVQ